MEIVISILGALSAITVAVIGPVFSNKNSNILPSPQAAHCEK